MGSVQFQLQIEKVSRRFAGDLLEIDMLVLEVKGLEFMYSNKYRTYGFPTSGSSVVLAIAQNKTIMQSPPG